MVSTPLRPLQHITPASCSTQTHSGNVVPTRVVYVCFIIITLACCLIWWTVASYRLINLTQCHHNKPERVTYTDSASQSRTEKTFRHKEIGITWMHGIIQNMNSRWYNFSNLFLKYDTFLKLNDSRVQYFVFCNCWGTDGWIYPALWSRIKVNVDVASGSCVHYLTLSVYSPGIIWRVGERELSEGYAVRSDWGQTGQRWMEDQSIVHHFSIALIKRSSSKG